MHFGFALELSDIDLWNTDLLDIHLDLLSRDKYTDIPSILFVSIKSLRGLQDMSSRRLQDMSSRRLQDMSSRRFQDMSSRRLQPNNFSSSKTSSRCLQDVLEDVKMLRWRRVEDEFKRCLEDVLKTSSRPKNVCWVLVKSKWKLLNQTRQIISHRSLQLNLWTMTNLLLYLRLSSSPLPNIWSTRARDM